MTAAPWAWAKIPGYAVTFLPPKKYNMAGLMKARPIVLYVKFCTVNLVLLTYVVHCRHQAWY